MGDIFKLCGPLSSILSIWSLFARLSAKKGLYHRLGRVTFTTSHLAHLERFRDLYLNVTPMKAYFSPHFLKITVFNTYRMGAIISRSWLQAIHKDRIFWKKLLKDKEMIFGNGVKNIQRAYGTWNMNFDFIFWDKLRLNNFVSRSTDL